MTQAANETFVPSQTVILPTAIIDKAMMEHPLFQVYHDVLHQVMRGKGQRHGGEAKPFMEQIWHGIANSHGLGFLTGQAQKKLCEAMESGNITANPVAFERELLGAIAYLGMAVVQYRTFQKMG